MSKLIHAVMPSLVLSCTLLSPAAAMAATVNREEIVMPVENCQAALPAYDGQIRKRPLAVQNEGTAPAFVTCAMKGAFAARAINSEVSITLVINRGGVITTTCTLVDGRDLAFSAPVYLSRTIVMPPSVPSTFHWSAADNGGNNFIYPAISCILPPGVAISDTRRVYQYED